ncbi:ABC transporter permease subunit [Lentibacter algarum]|uniref:ABC transporter permease subunit n=1 Tax=Lentibacter algarum TaxID=576131 RepID=UPI001C079E0E|nr:ABC transporter permease subunit [Lentibacter algarum]MBU2980214.1 ABC transporter permease subunit [Lentibacter algarum]
MTALLRKSRDRLGRGFVLLPPFLWMFLFFLVPFLFVLKISFSEAIIASPPFAPLFEYDPDEGVVRAVLRFFNYGYLIDDDLYLRAYLNSLKVAAVSTVICLLIGYPMALAIARSPKARQPLLLVLIMLPFWTSLLIRVYAWIGILRQDGVVNNILMGLGVIDEPLVLLQTVFATYVGIVYAYLPFMILPLYAVLEKQDTSLLEAARDLGARPIVTFMSVTLPLSTTGIIAGSMLVFIPVVGEFVIPALLSGNSTLMIGKVLWTEFFSNRDWPVASAVAIVMLVVLLIPIMIFQNQQSKERN